MVRRTSVDAGRTSYGREPFGKPVSKRGRYHALRRAVSKLFLGIDMLADAREYTTAKQAQSVSRQMGRSGVISELYGVTNWNFDFRGHKLQGDWQAALGVTVRVPHLSWMYMGGESKRDYPAPIDSHSPWYRKYTLIEDHFARVNVAMTRGKAVVHVGVVHPIESMFMEFGPEKETIEKRSLMEEQFQNLNLDGCCLVSRILISFPKRFCRNCPKELPGKDFVWER